MDDRRGAPAAAARLTARSGWGALERGGVVAADDLGDQLLAAMLPPSTMSRPGGEQLASPSTSASSTCSTKEAAASRADRHSERKRERKRARERANPQIPVPISWLEEGPWHESSGLREA